MALTTTVVIDPVSSDTPSLDVVKSMIEKEVEQRIILQTNEINEIRVNCCSDKRVCTSFLVGYLFKIGILILVFFFVLRSYRIKHHPIPTGYTYYNGAFMGSCDSNDMILCEPYNDGCMCSTINIGITREEHVRNVILDIITYLLPIILSGIITYIEWKIFIRLQKVSSTTDGTDIIYNTLDLFASELTTIGLVYKSRIDKLIYGTNLSQGCKDALYLYFANKVYNEPDDTEIEVPIIKCDNERNPVLISIYEIPRNKLFRYQYFVAMSKEMNLKQYVPSSTSNLSSSLMTLENISISILDNHSIEDYKALLDFINDVYPPDTTDYHSLYRIAEAYGMTDCMGYCYLLYPELFTVIRPTDLSAKRIIST
jgi:hypothetical protein